jgi:hypothetical protein
MNTKTSLRGTKPVIARNEARHCEERSNLSFKWQCDCWDSDCFVPRNDALRSSQ